ncbi:hypothetical protein V6N12_006540 [Hibiscus sabdariffa]|uniref:Nodulin-like domain-containing protein n=1 Tax=Hibiscus sabdariffa TaxID=183260 RepID=A0ABR2EZ62_9ROSI
MGIRETYTFTSAWKWLGFVSAVWVQAISGNNYSFSNYSDAIKTLMNLTQLELNNLSLAKDVGKAFGLLVGLASDRLPTPVILLIGATEGLIGYGAQWLVVCQKIQPLFYCPLVVPVYSFLKSWGLIGFEADIERHELLLKEETTSTEEEKTEVVPEQKEAVHAASAVVEKTRSVIGEEHTMLEAM